MVEDYFQNNPEGKLVVFAFHKSVQERLFKELKKYNPLWLKGEMTSKEKAQIEKMFNNEEQNKVLVASLMAGKEGLTLTRADTTIFAELWFNPQDLAQAEDRIHRIGQKNVAKIYYVIGKDTIDEKIWETISKRNYAFKRVFNPLANSKPTTKQTKGIKL
jgi:SWI/SNF-related matrix-associated actin-dependent regulator 1 of chromatin subfamily A